MRLIRPSSPYLLLALLLALLAVPRQASGEPADPLDGLLSRLPDATLLVAGFDPALLAGEGSTAWLERLAPGSAAPLADLRAAFRTAAAALLIVRAVDRPAPILVVAARGDDETTRGAFAKIAAPGRAAIRMSPGIIASGPETELRALLDGEPAGSLAALRRRMKSPRAFAVITPDNLVRAGLAARPSAAEHPLLRDLFARLERVELVAYDGAAGLHLTLNATLRGMPDANLAARLAALEKDFATFVKHRGGEPVAPFADPRSIRLRATAHPGGAILDLAPFPDALPELFLHLFHPDGKPDLRDLLTLAALAELVLRFDRAVELFDRARAEGERMTERRLADAAGRLAAARSRRDSSAAAAAEADAKRARETGAAFADLVDDLRLEALLLSGREKDTRRALSAAGAAKRFPRATALLDRLTPAPAPGKEPRR